jgi:exosortase A-associated hydrolase 1
MSESAGSDVGGSRGIPMTTIPFVESASTFACDGDTSVAIMALPKRGFARGVLIVVGGPQYRSGSHRQFTLLSRSLAAHGIPAMRFDYRGMGDSDGLMRSFENVEADLRAALDHFFAECGDIKEVVLWGLCDAASAALFYAWRDPRVTGLVLLNPWVRTAAGVASAYMKGYYAKRLMDRELWSKILAGRFSLMHASRSLFANAIDAYGLRNSRVAGKEKKSADLDLPARMLVGWNQFRGKILLILSGNDLTADEFRALVARDTQWRNAISEPRVQQLEIADANHTFASAHWRREVEGVTIKWVMAW